MRTGRMRTLAALTLCLFGMTALADAATYGTIHTITGSNFGDGVTVTGAPLSTTRGVAVDSAGNIYIADSNHHCIRKVTAATGVITTVAGNGTLKVKVPTAVK